MNHSFKTLGLSLSLIMMLTGTANAAVVATINGKELTKEDFDRRYKENIQIFKFAPPSKANVLEDIINFELAVQEAKRQGIDKKPEIQERINSVLKQALIENQLSEKFKKEVAISEREAKNYCQRNPAIKTSHIWVSLSPEATADEVAQATQKINAAAAALKQGEKFEAVAAKYSDGTIAQSGGDLGFLTPADLDPEYYKAARKLSDGEISGPVRSQTGLHLIKMAGTQDCDSVNIADWQRMVFDQKRLKIYEDYMSSLRSKANNKETNDLNLAVAEAQRLGLDKTLQTQERVNAVIYQALIDQNITNKLKKELSVSTREARAYCQKNPPIRTSHIWVPLNPVALKAEETAAYKKIRDAQGALNRGMKFEQAVAQYSDGSLASSGGDTGFLTPTEMDPSFYQAARKLKVGQVSAPVRSKLGLHIIKLTGVQSCRNINVADWQRIVFDQRRMKVFDTFLSGLRSKAKVSINKELIKE